MCDGRRDVRACYRYSFPNGPSPLGRHEHGTNWPGTKTARPGSYRARAKHGTAPCPCLGRDASTMARHGHDPLQWLARGRHDLELLDGAPRLLTVGSRGRVGRLYKPAAAAPLLARSLSKPYLIRHSVPCPHSSRIELSASPID